MKSIKHSSRIFEYDLTKPLFNRHKKNGKDMFCSHVQCGIPLNLGARIVSLRVSKTGTIRFLHKKCAKELNII